MTNTKKELNKENLEESLEKVFPTQNLTVISKDIDIELKRCFNCEDDFPIEDLENVYNQIVDPSLFCKFGCAEEARETHYSGEQ